MAEAIHTNEIETPRLILRGAKPTDSRDLHECFRDPEVMRYWSTLPHENLKVTSEWVRKMCESANNGVTDFVIYHKASQTIIGKIGVFSGNEIGYMIARKYWRQGLISEALTAVISHVFAIRDFGDIVADIDPGNEASRQLLLKFGFWETGRREKTIEVGGIWCDSLDLKLLRTDWETRLH